MSQFPSTPTPLASLVEAGEGSVVSKVLSRKDDCTITLFAFARGEGLTEHTSPHAAVLLMVEGEMDITLRPAGGDPERHRIRTGETLRIAPSVPHELHGGEPYKMLLLLMKEVDPAG